MIIKMAMGMAKRRRARIAKLLRVPPVVLPVHVPLVNNLYFNTEGIIAHRFMACALFVFRRLYALKLSGWKISKFSFEHLRSFLPVYCEQVFFNSQNCLD